MMIIIIIRKNCASLLSPLGESLNSSTDQSGIVVQIQYSISRTIGRSVDRTDGQSVGQSFAYSLLLLSVSSFVLFVSLQIKCYDNKFSETYSRGTSHKCFL